MQELGYPSSKDLIELVETGGILNCPVTAHDIRRAERIYGPDIPSLKGKTKTQKPLDATVEYIPRPAMQELTLHCDLMFVKGDPYLLTVFTPLGLTMCTHLSEGRGIESVRKALFLHITSYEAERFVVRNILSDLEGSIAALSTDLNQRRIRVTPSGPG